MYRSTLMIALVVTLWSAATLRLEAKPYKGAEYRTKTPVLYGRIEARIKANGREGMLTSLFTYNDTYPSTAWNEIDIEIMGRYTDDIQFNPITPGQVNHVSHYHVPFNPALDYHVYAFEWTPTYVAWFVDGAEAHRQTGSHIAALNIPQKIMMNVWNPAYPNWAGTWNDAVLPAFAYYDWISYASFTPDSGTVGTDSNFTPQWRDDFNSWDTARWDKATHTFNGNNCDFIRENAVFSDGKLILCLTKETAIGYTDNVPPIPMWARVEGNKVRLMFSEEVEPASATTTSNYLASGAQISSVELLPDQKTVLIVATGIDTSATTAMIVQNIRDRWSTPNVLQPRAMLLSRTTPVADPIRINIGGPAYQSYLADQEWGPLVEYGRMDGQSGYFSGAVIAGTTEQEIFRSELSGLCEYKIRVPNGRYAVILMMAENYFNGANQRKFNVTVQGMRIEAELDLVSRVGFRAAYQRATFVEVTNGEISIHMQALIDQPLLNGISISRLTDVKEERGDVDLEGYRLEQNYPNPFNGGTTIRFSIPQSDELSLKVFDTLGRVVSTRHLGSFDSGTSQITWDAMNDAGTSLPSGVYYYHIEGRHRSRTKTLVYLK